MQKTVLPLMKSFAVFVEAMRLRRKKRQAKKEGRVMRMIVTVEEMKNYLRIDFEDDDALIEHLIMAAVKQCMDIMRTEDEADLIGCANGKISIMFMVAYLYEHREEANHLELNLTLRALLFGSRKEGF